jgi:DNA mismatch endonuclease (patch repair protein)
MMSGIRGRDTAPERIVRSLLHRAGFRFRLHRRDLPGRPDIVMRRHRTVVFVHGCFWHAHSGCPLAKEPATNAEFWRAKLRANRERDRRAVERLLELGWRVAVIWECAVRGSKDHAGLAGSVAAWIAGNSPYSEYPPPGALG